MRAIALMSLCLVTACSEGATDKPKADTSALKLAAGQWETTTIIETVKSQDNGAPVMKAGEKMTLSTCVSESEGKKPAPAVLGGMESCTYDTLYMSRGRITAALSCTKPGLQGRVMVSSEGKYAADSFDTNAVVQTSLVTDGDVKATAKITGRRTGACAVPGAVN